MQLQANYVGLSRSNFFNAAFKVVECPEKKQTEEQLPDFFVDKKLMWMEEKESQFADIAWQKEASVCQKTSQMEEIAWNHAQIEWESADAPNSNCPQLVSTQNSLAQNNSTHRYYLRKYGTCALMFS